MAFEIEQTGIEGLVFIKAFFSEDMRGYYKKVFERERFESVGLPTQFFEFSDIRSRRGAVRGLHYQDRHSQGKLLHVVSGRIYDVALDLREQSRTFGKWYAVTLCGGEERSLFIPSGFAHGFMALEDDTLFTYQCTNYYEPDSCGGILWNDPDLAIPWPITDGVILTDKDKAWPTFAEYCRQQNISAGQRNGAG